MIMIVAMLAMLYFFMIRPENKRKKEAQNMRDSLTVGDVITTIGGKELLYAAQGIMNRTYEAMFPLLGVALIYLILVMLFTWLLSKFERRLAQSDR